MTNQHPITPSPEMVRQWIGMLCLCSDEEGFTKIAQWGADQQLQADGEWLRSKDDMNEWAEELCATMRPKPPSLRKQAYDALDTYIYGEPDPKDKERTYNTIRRALEALPND